MAKPPEPFDASESNSPITPKEGKEAFKELRVIIAKNLRDALRKKEESGTPLTDKEVDSLISAEATIVELDPIQHVVGGAPPEFDLSSADVLGEVAKDSVESVADKMEEVKDSPLPVPEPLQSTPTPTPTPSSNLPAPSPKPGTPSVFGNPRDLAEKQERRERERFREQEKERWKSPLPKDAKMDLPVPSSPLPPPLSSKLPLPQPNTYEELPINQFGDPLLDIQSSKQSKGLPLPTPSLPLPGPPGSTIIPRPPSPAPKPIPLDNKSRVKEKVGKSQGAPNADRATVSTIPQVDSTPFISTIYPTPPLPPSSPNVNYGKEDSDVPYLEPVVTPTTQTNKNFPLPTPKFPRGEQRVPGMGNPPGTPSGQQGQPPTGASSYSPTKPPTGNYPWPPPPSPPGGGSPGGGGFGGVPPPPSPPGGGSPGGGGFGGVPPPPSPPGGGSPGGGGFGGMMNNLQLGMPVGGGGMSMYSSNPMFMMIQEMQRRFSAAKEAVSEIGETAKAERVGDVGSHAAGVIEKTGGAMGNPIVEYFGKLAKVLPESVEGLRKWSQQLHESNMKFSEFSASMAWTQARQEVRDIELSRTRGERRADSAEMLARSKHRLEEQIAPWEDKLANMKNQMMSDISGILFLIVEKMNAIAIYLKILTEDKEKGEGVGLGQSIANIAEKDFTKEYGRPPRFPNS